MAASTASAASPGTTATSLPSLARYRASSPRISHTPRTSSRTGRLSSVRRIATFEPSANSLSTVARPPRVASRRQWMSGQACEHGGHQAVQRLAVALQLGLQRQLAAGLEDGGAVVAQKAVDDDLVARSGAVRRDVDARRHHADARGVDEQLVRLAAVHHLGVAGDDGHAGLGRGRRHAGEDAVQGVDGQAFLQDQAAGQVAAARRRPWPGR